MSSPAVPERFEVLETLSTTDAVVLLRARDSLLDREVVLKLPGEGMKGHPSAEGRVLRGRLLHGRIHFIQLAP